MQLSKTDCYHITIQDMLWKFS